MSEGETTAACQRHPYVDGEILFRSIYQSPRVQLPSVGRFLSQGAAVGPLLAFLWPLMGMLWHPENGYNFLLISYLPFFLGGGLLFGLCVGVAIWSVTYLWGRRINAVVRAVLGIVILNLLSFVFNYLFSERSAYDQEVPWKQRLLFYGVFWGCGAIFGLVVGSRFRPVYELLRGTAEQWPVMCGLTGLLLRLLVIFALMVSILSLIPSTQGDFHRTEFAFSLIAVCHFAIALLILFVRLPFWLLLPLALIINFPTVALVTNVLRQQDDGIRILTLSYLCLWAAFLSFRASLSRRPLAFIKSELKYYFE